MPYYNNIYRQINYRPIMTYIYKSIIQFTIVTQEGTTSLHEEII
jgi:hypothetical protein